MLISKVNRKGMYLDPLKGKPIVLQANRVNKCERLLQYSEDDPRIPDIPIACKLEVVSQDLLDHKKFPEAYYWNVKQVADWIVNIGFPQYRDSFELNYIYGKMLFGLEARHLPKLNITDFNHIKTISREIRSLFGNLLSPKNEKIWETTMHPQALYMLHRPYTTLKMTDFFKEWNIVPDTNCESRHHQDNKFEVPRCIIKAKKDKFLFDFHGPTELPFKAYSFLQGFNAHW